MPSRSVNPRLRRASRYRRIGSLVDNVGQIVEAAGVERPAAIQRSRDWPPFHARVVMPRISTLTQRSKVRAKEVQGRHRRSRDGKKQLYTQSSQN
jgi:hypothetical protein